MTNNPIFWFIVGFLACEVTDIIALLIHLKRLKK